MKKSTNDRSNPAKGEVNFISCMTDFANEMEKVDMGMVHFVNGMR